MSGINLFKVQQDIKAYMIVNVGWYVDSGNVPDAHTLHLNNGVLDPYVILRFADMMPTSNGGGFGGAIYNEYYSYVDCLCIGASDTTARELASLCDRLLIGKKFTNTGEVMPNFGGGLFAISLNDQHPLAFIAVTSFRFTFNMIAGEESIVVP